MQQDMQENHEMDEMITTYMLYVSGDEQDTWNATVMCGTIEDALGQLEELMEGAVTGSFIAIEVNEMPLAVFESLEDYDGETVN